MGHDVDIPNSLPLKVGNLNPSFDCNTRVEAQQVNVPKGLSGLINGPADFDFVCDVGSDRDPTNVFGYCGRRLEVKIDYDDSSSIGLDQPTAKRGADPACAACDESDLSREIYDALSGGVATVAALP